jgi:hypothetical protein
VRRPARSRAGRRHRRRVPSRSRRSASRPGREPLRRQRDRSARGRGATVARFRPCSASDRKGTAGPPIATSASSAAYGSTYVRSLSAARSRRTSSARSAAPLGASAAASPTARRAASVREPPVLDIFRCGANGASMFFIPRTAPVPVSALGRRRTAAPRSQGPAPWREGLSRLAARREAPGSRRPVATRGRHSDNARTPRRSGVPVGAVRVTGSAPTSTNQSGPGAPTPGSC